MKAFILHRKNLNLVYLRFQYLALCYFEASRVQPFQNADDTV